MPKKKPVVEERSLELLPPPKHCCQVCAWEHRPEQPHNFQTLYYKIWFQKEYGRAPTWEDAMMHCEDEVKEQWKIHLREFGVQI